MYMTHWVKDQQPQSHSNEGITVNTTTNTTFINNKQDQDLKKKILVLDNLYKSISKSKNTLFIIPYLTLEKQLNQDLAEDSSEKEDDYVKRYETPLANQQKRRMSVKNMVTFAENPINQTNHHTHKTRPQTST